MGVIILEKIATCMFMAEDRAAVSSETQSVYHIDDVISQKIMAGYI
jgi:hypothetical protein